jgi:isoquinoline 1-oxidoreductase alpha subunit
MVAFNLNGKAVSVQSEDSTPLLWVLRDELKLTGTKFGCGIAQCGACTVHVNGKAVRSCVTPVSTVAGAQVKTIEGIAEEVPQCGYCQSGQIMKAAELLAANPKPTREQIVAHMDGNICRCGTYHRIAKAIERASQEA